MPKPQPGSGWAPAPEWVLSSSSEEERHLGWLYLFLMTLLAAFLRFFLLGHQSLWVDEIITWRACRPDAGLNLWSQFLETIQGPLYLAALWPLVRVNTSEFLLRLPAALAAIATVPLLAMVTGKLFGTRTARLVALLLALSPFHVWYAQEARGYSFVIFFGVAASLVFLIMIERGPRPKSLLLYIFLMACAVLSNMSALFLWAAHGMTLLLVSRPRDGRTWLLWFLGLAGAVLVVAPWILQATGIWAVDRLVPGSGTGDALRGETTFTVLALPFTFFTFFYGYSLGPSLRELHQPDRMQLLMASWPLLAPAALVLTLSLFSGLVRLRGRQWTIAIWIAVPLLSVTMLAVRNVKPFNPRYLAVVFPWILVLATTGLLNLPRRAAQILTILLCGLFLWSLSAHYFNPRYAKADMRGAAEVVSLHQKPGDLVFSPVVSAVFRYYYAGPNELADTTEIVRLQTESEVREYFREKVSGADRCWVVLARSWFIDPHDWFPIILVQEGVILDEYLLAGVRLYYWQRSFAESGPDVQ